LGRGREGAYRALVSKTEGNRSPGRPRGRWKNNIVIDFQHKMMGGEKVRIGTIWLRVGKNGELL
jgi:hypothetical protein